MTKIPVFCAGAVRLPFWPDSPFIHLEPDGHGRIKDRGILDRPYMSIYPLFLRNPPDPPIYRPLWRICWDSRGKSPG